MSTVVSIEAYKLHKCLDYLVPMVPKGSIEIPLGINLSKGKLYLTCSATCILQSVLDVDCTDTEAITVIYYTAVGGLLPSEGLISLEFIPTGIVISGNGFETTLPIGYSTVPIFDFGEHLYKDITQDSYVDSMSALLNMNLDKLYLKAKPISIYQGVSVLKYPNTWVQVRSLGLPFVGTIDPEHLRMLIKFRPKKISADEEGALILMNTNTTLKIPCHVTDSENNFTSLLNECTNTITVNMSGYLDKVRNAAKLDNKAPCRITLYEEGLKTTVNVGHTSINISTGDISSEVVSVIHLPLPVWITFLKAISSGIVQILTGGDKLCLRNQSMIILTRAIP